MTAASSSGGGEGAHLHDPVTGQHLTFLQSARDTNGELLQVEVRLDPGGWVPRHVHARQDERIEVLAGSLTLVASGKELHLDVGDTAHVPRRKLHVVRNSSDDQTRFMLEVRPARRMEGAMRALFAVMRFAAPVARLRRR